MQRSKADWAGSLVETGGLLIHCGAAGGQAGVGWLSRGCDICLLDHMCQRRTALQEGCRLVKEEIHPIGVPSLSLGSQVILNLISTRKAVHIETLLTSPFIT